MVKKKYTEFGRILQCLQDNLGLTLSEFSDRCGYEKTYISKMRNGNTKITDEFIKKLITTFNLSKHDVFVLENARRLSIREKNIKLDLSKATISQIALVESLSDSILNLSDSEVLQIQKILVDNKKRNELKNPNKGE